VEAIAELLSVTVNQPGRLIEGLPDPLGQELVLLRDPRLTIIQVTIGPGLQYPPHNHGMEAAIGLYAGLERNLWFGGGQRESISVAGASELRAKDSIRMKRDVIHAVANPSSAYSAGVHVYLGDLIVHDRTLWHPDTLQPMPFDNDKYFGLVREEKAAQVEYRQSNKAANLS
jgi:predicted metal-dependent enzyme (double-stranded beta helix superfamily)